MRFVPAIPVIAGAAMGAAFALRFSEIVFLAPLAAVVLLRPVSIRQRCTDLLAVGAGFAASTVLLVGVWDLATWGRPFSSLIEFARYTLVARESSSLVKVQPWFWYLLRLPKWLPVAIIPLFFALRRYRWLTTPMCFIILPLTAFSIIHHKELRYLQGIIPFVAIATAGAVSIWWERGRRRSVVILLTLSLAFGVSYPSFLGKKSMAAVDAARWIADIPGVRSVGLSQPWAYGATLFLPAGVRVIDVGPSPNPVELEAFLPQCDLIALYRDQIDGTPKLIAPLQRHGFAPARGFEWGRSRSVIVFASASLSTLADAGSPQRAWRMSGAAERVPVRVDERPAAAWHLDRDQEAVSGIHHHAGADAGSGFKPEDAMAWRSRRSGPSPAQEDGPPISG